MVADLEDDELFDGIFSALGLSLDSDSETKSQWYDHRRCPRSSLHGEQLMVIRTLYLAMLDWLWYSERPNNRFARKLASDVPDWVNGKCGAITFELVSVALDQDLDNLRKAMHRWLKNPIAPTRF